MRYSKRPNNSKKKDIRDTKNVSVPKNAPNNKDSSYPNEYSESIQRETEEGKKL